MILGLTGSIGSGKSTVARMFQDLAGAEVIDADAIAHQVQAPGGRAYTDIVLAFGNSILTSDGAIDRKKLAAEVFQDPEKRKRLNSIVHPKVREEELRLLNEYAAQPLVVFMVPLLFENGLERYCDKTVVVSIDDATRRQRLWQRSGMTGKEVENRLSAQMPDASKVARADFVINNSGSLARTQEQVRQVLQKLAPAGHGSQV